MRRPDWKERFDEAVATASLLPFHYGQHDCCLFVAYVLDRMCDSNYVQRVKQAYGYVDELSAIDILQDHGGLRKVVTEWLGEPISIEQAKPGDVALLRVGSRVSLGIIEAHNVLGAAFKGVEAVPLRYAECAWRIE